MTTNEMLILGLVIGALSLFAGVLAFASWEDTRMRRRQNAASKGL